MSTAEPEKPHRYAAQVEVSLLLKCDVGCAGCGIGQEVLELRRAAGK